MPWENKQTHISMDYTDRALFYLRMWSPGQRSFRNIVYVLGNLYRSLMQESEQRQVKDGARGLHQSTGYQLMAWPLTWTMQP